MLGRILPVTLLVSVLVVLSGLPAAGDPPAREYTKADLTTLLEWAERDPRPNLQMKVTWCGDQTIPITTVVLGSVGHGMLLEKYEPLRVERWHYANDDPWLAHYHQLTTEEWTRLLGEMIDAGIEDEINPDRPPEKERFHVLVTRSGLLGRKIQYAELFLDSDEPELRKLVVASLREDHPARSGLASRLFRGN